MDVSECLRPYRDLAYLLLNTEFTYLTRRLVPGDSLDRASIPATIAHSYDDMLFGGILFDCAPATVCEIKTPFGICFSALQLWRSEGFALIGPYLPEQTENMELEAVMAREGVPVALKDQYQTYFRRLPTLSKEKVRAVFSALAAGVYGERLAPEAACLEISPESPSPCPVFEGDSMQVRADAIAKRYAHEHRFMELVSHGDTAVLGMFENYSSVFFDRVPNKLRNEKNMLIVMNTLLRKAVERAEVHPFYIDGLSSQWAKRIEELDSLSQIAPARHEMLLEYCRLAQTRSLSGYSPNVRNMLCYVQFNLAGSISLEAIAQRLGTNASYLSSQFNREVGKSLPEYVSEKRIAEAQRLLRATQTLPVGQIAAAVGFSDVNYFTKVFKKNTGQTPTAYRAAIRARAAASSK